MQKNEWELENFKGDKFEAKIHTLEYNHPIIVIYGKDGRLIDLGLSDIKRLQEILEQVKDSALKHVTP